MVPPRQSFTGSTSGGMTAMGVLGSAFGRRARPRICATSPAFAGVADSMRTIGK
jgi:hypothetical protein